MVAVVALYRAAMAATVGTCYHSSHHIGDSPVPTAPDRTRAILSELRALCMSPCTMPPADRLAHCQSVAAMRARDEARRNGGPQIPLRGL